MQMPVIVHDASVNGSPQFDTKALVKRVATGSYSLMNRYWHLQASSTSTKSRSEPDDRRPNLARPA
ncbi:hypothetical protein E4U22_001502 [Claviceps purpurea]|nr:hypothetical protein E4U22_001502 [Claviceps purpurea]